MKVELFSVHDSAANRFIDPFPAPTIEFAIRGFKEACLTEGHQFAKFPDDYTLFHVGEFNAELGVIHGLNARKIAIAASFLPGGQTDLVTDIEGGIA